MITVLDAGSAMGVVLGLPEGNIIAEQLNSSKWVIAPELFISEVTNVFWKYHQFENLPIELSETGIDQSIALIDEFVGPQELYREAFSMACSAKHSVYDMLYLVVARRNNGLLLTTDNVLKAIAKNYLIRTSAGH